jgi:hypothetical protein
METNKLEKIYLLNIDILNEITQVIASFRKQNIYRGTKIFKKLIQRIQVLMSDLLDNNFNVDNEYILSILKSLINAQENEDNVLLADLLELQFTPFLLDLQNMIREGEDFPRQKNFYDSNLSALKEFSPNLAVKLENKMISEKYTIETTAIGSLTVKANRQGKSFYLHSNNNPLAEAEQWIEEYYNPEAGSYVVYGIGLGYHIQALYDRVKGCRIDVVESDYEMLKHALTYFDFSSMISNNVYIHYDPDFSVMKEKLNDQQICFLIHYPSMRLVKKKDIQERMKQIFIANSSFLNIRKKMQLNFVHNIKNCTNYVDELADVFEGKDVYIIAAGPSLDKNLDLLKSKPKNSIILAVGAVFKKLLAKKIDTDYVIISDANEIIYNQIEGFENEGIPLLLLSTVYREIAEKYKGKKYLICQNQYEPAENYARTHNCYLYNTGGSVSTIALDVAIQLKAGRIVFLGLDLAYTGNLAHAEGTGERSISGTEDLKQVESIDGGKVYAGSVFIMYREWIERRIVGVPEIEIINATEGGARIKGTKERTLREILNK